MHRRSLLAAALLVSVAVLAPVTQAAHAPKQQYVAPAGSGALFLVSGHGWGHGVGMGQWGAEGYALQGYTYDQILSAYYPGTTPAQTTVKTIRVLVASGKKQLLVSSDAPIAVADATGAKHTLAAGRTKLTRAFKLAVDGGPATALEPPLTLSPAAGSSLTLGRAYRGKLVVDVVNGKLQAVNILPLEQYLDSVVASEMPSTWLPDALEAQAVASRSFAVAARRPGGPFDVYPDGRSQAYLGLSAETPEATAAVEATAGEVLMYGGKVATTVFSSSTGGWTQSAQDAWGGARPYLVSEADPFDAISPYHNWGPVPVTAKTLGKALGIAGRLVDATVTRNSSKRVADLDVTSLRNGADTDATATGATVAAKLDLRSTWFSVGVLALLPPLPNVPVSAGSTVTLTGVVRGLRNVVLQQRTPGTAGAAWDTIETVTPEPGTGAISVDVTPSVTTDYRLANAAAAAAYVRIHVE
ncbi:MAG TPA: SpoIID/LytB domain-containing protein [Gaiellaceae bacterium]|nr:SpoIID/LytB domain-containing protein [Gaiellaceae bacterium]